MNKALKTFVISTFIYFLYDFTDMYVKYYIAFNSYNENIKQIRGNKIINYFFEEPYMPIMPHDYIILCFLFFSPIFFIPFIPFIFLL